MLTEQGIRVCAPIHDAVIIDVPLTELKARLAEARRMMAKASALVLDGFALTSDKMYITEMTPWEDARGKKLWEKLVKHLLHPPAPDTKDEHLPGIEDSSLLYPGCQVIISEVVRHG
jgi:hypothetical protein